MALPARKVGASPASTDSISTLLEGYSLEATLPKEAEIEALKKEVPVGTRIYLSCPPNSDPMRLIESSVQVRNVGLEPVPHLTARTYENAAAVERVLSRLANEAGVRSVLTIAGDRDEKAGAFEGALDLIESGVLEACGVREIYVSGYPDGHPKIDDQLIASVLPKKLEAARRRNLAVSITTQFCFEPDLILAWLRKVRAAGVDVPISVGVAGPTSMRALMRFALRCGVRASLKGVMNPKALQLFGDAAPDTIIRALADAEDRPQLGQLSVHFFSFGGLVSTAEWAEAVAEGKIRPTNDGFVVLK